MNLWTWTLSRSLKILCSTVKGNINQSSLLILCPRQSSWGFLSATSSVKSHHIFRHIFLNIFELFLLILTNLKPFFSTFAFDFPYFNIFKLFTYAWIVNFILSILESEPLSLLKALIYFCNMAISFQVMPLLISILIHSSFLFHSSIYPLTKLFKAL